MKKFLSLLVFLAFLIASKVSFAEAGVLLVADFDSCSKPNNLGGNFGAWNKDPNDTTQGCVDSFDGDVKYGMSGYSLKLAYDVDSPNPAYCGFWMDLKETDAREYNSLVFYIKGDEGEGYTTQFKIELKNANGEVGRTLVTGVTDKWKRVVVPFRKITGLTDWSKLTQFIIVFDDINATKKVGIIYVDRITLETL